MKIRAAVLEQFGSPLVVQEIDLAEPKAGEVLVRLAACGVCHTDLYTASGADPTGYAPCVLGHEGAGVVERVGAGVTLVAPGDHVITLFAPECGKCVHCPSAHEPLRRHPRPAGRSATCPTGPTRFSRDGEPLRHFMGTSTFAEYTVMPEIALAKVSPEAPLEGCAPFACGLSTGIGAALYTAAGRARLDVRRLRLRPRRPRRRDRLPARRRGRIIAVDLSEERLAQARHHGATRRALPATTLSTGSVARRAASGPTTRSRRPGIVAVMRQAVEVGARGVGPRHDVRRRRQGRGARDRSALPDHGRRVTGSSFGGVKGRTQVPLLVDRWLAGEIDVESLISHRITLDEVNHGFELMEAQDGIRSVITFD